MSRPPLLRALLLVSLAVGCGDDGPTGPGPEPGVAAIAVGRQHACRITAAGTYCWGGGEDGQLGIGAVPTLAPPTLLENAPELVALAAGSTHTCGLDQDGLAYCWGSDRDGQLGLGVEAAERCGGIPCATRPAPVTGELRFRLLTGGDRFTCGVTLDGTGYCWGLNDLGQLGTAADQDSCVDARCSRRPLAIADTPELAAVSAGTFHACALGRDGQAYCWGWLPNPHALNPQFLPDATPVGDDLRFARLEAGGLHTCAVTPDEAAYCWGIDAMGAGPTTRESVEPIAVAGGLRFAAVASARYTSCGLDPDGAAYCWGPNSNGEIGREPVGTSVRFDEPAAVSGGLRFTEVTGGSGSYCGITTTGATVCWGRGTEGQLGSGTEDSASPVVVPGL
jgi:alpha-tubulin suppressor-like RCC1 family protein